MRPNSLELEAGEASGFDQIHELVGDINWTPTAPLRQLKHPVGGKPLRSEGVPVNRYNDVGVIRGTLKRRFIFVKGIHKVGDVKRPKTSVVAAQRKKLSISLQK